MQKSDAVVVFPGSDGRRAAGYQLIQQGYATNLVFTSGHAGCDYRNAEMADLDEYSARLFCGNARSTVEDAIFTREIIEREGFRSIILVTSEHHLPRASFLLRAALASSNVRVYTYGVPFETDPIHHNNKRPPTLTQVLFDERIKFLGSLLEMGIYRATGALLNDSERIRQAKTNVKRLILFDES